MITVKMVWFFILLLLYFYLFCLLYLSCLRDWWLLSLFILNKFILLLSFRKLFQFGNALDTVLYYFELLLFNYFTYLLWKLTELLADLVDAVVVKTKDFTHCLDWYWLCRCTRCYSYLFFVRICFHFLWIIINYARKV